MKSTESPDIRKILITIFTPGPLDSPVKFSWRVLTSWFVTGWGFGLLMVLMAAFGSGGIKDPGTAISVVLFACPIALIIYGFLGLGIDLVRGKKLSHTGWVWYFYPLLSVFWVAIGILGLIIGLAGLSIPKQPTPKMPYRRLLDMISKMSSLEFVSDFGDPVIDILLKEGKLQRTEHAAIDKAKELANSQPRQQLGNSLTSDELNKLAVTIGITTLEQVHGIEVVNIPAGVP